MEKPPQMLALSNLLHYMLVDNHQKTVNLSDFAIDLSQDDYPRVIYVLGHKLGQERIRAPWEAVCGLDHQNKRIELEDLEQAEPTDQEWMKKRVLLKRDILDALMLDLKNRTTIIANDLWLEEKDGNLRLKAVDRSFRAILRRLTRGFIAGHSRGRLLDWRFSEFLRGDPEAARAGLDYHGLIDRLPPGEIAYLADQLPYLYATELLTLLPEPTAADAIEVMMPELQVQVFEELPKDRAAGLLTLMRPDIVAGLLSNLGMDQAKEWLEKTPSLISDRVLHLLRYPRDTAAGIMTNDMVTLPQETSAADALQVLRDLLKRPEAINFIQMVYVVDNENQQKLQGALSLRDLLVADEGSRLENIMNRYMITLEPLEPAKTAARRVIESALAALPVIGDGGKIIGIVPVDTALTLTMPKRGEREVLRLFS